MQEDGNLVVYDGAGDALWSIQTGTLPGWWAPWDPRLGLEIATVGYDAVQGEDPHHIEFMYDSTGGGGPSYFDRTVFMPASAVNPANGCPHYSWHSAGTSVDPCAELAHLMAGRLP